MSRSANAGRNRTNWNQDQKSQRARKGAETKSARRNERRDIQNAMYGQDRFDREDRTSGLHS
jgi:hypothetical protein